MAEKWEETADRGEGTGEDKEGTQRQGPPIDMFNRSTEPFFLDWINETRRRSRPASTSTQDMEPTRFQNKPNNTTTKQKRKKVKRDKSETNASSPRDETKVGLMEMPGRLRNRVRVLQFNGVKGDARSVWA